MMKATHTTQQQLSTNPAFKDLKEKFLEKHRPTIIIEIDDEKLEKVNELLNELDYTVSEILQKGNYVYK